MKITAFILAFLVLGSIFMPCADSEPDQHQGIELLSELTDDFDAHVDICSPLCSCHCCHSHVVSNILSLEFDEPLLSMEHSSYQASIIDKTFPFWQPPKIS